MSVTTASDRYWSKVDKDGPTPDHRPELGQCWVWLAGKDTCGYGRIRMFGSSGYLAHRVSWEAIHGPVPEGLELDHLCRHRACVNPEHLEAVTHAENVRRGITRNECKTHCANGHEFTPENTSSLRGGTSRGCRTCARAHTAAWRERQRQQEAA